MTLQDSLSLNLFWCHYPLISTMNKQTQFLRKHCRFIVTENSWKHVSYFSLICSFRIEFSILVHCALFKLGFDFDGAEESPTFCCWFLLLLFPGKLKGRLPAPPLEFPAVPEPPGSISGRNFGGFFWSIFCQKVPNSVHFLLFFFTEIISQPIECQRYFLRL